MRLPFDIQKVPGKWKAAGRTQPAKISGYIYAAMPMVHDVTFHSSQLGDLLAYPVCHLHDII